jgi:hypothetical protein
VRTPTNVYRTLIKARISQMIATSDDGDARIGMQGKGLSVNGGAGGWMRRRVKRRI